MTSPYTIDIGDERLAATKAKVKAYSWSELPDAGGWTAGVGVDDSPVGAAGWILEKFSKWVDLPKLADGSPVLSSKFSDEELLTNIMFDVATSSVGTATWNYHGKRLEGSDRFPFCTRVKVPMGVAAFPEPLFLPGWHFAALEQPDLMLADLQAFVSTIMTGGFYE